MALLDAAVGGYVDAGRLAQLALTEVVLLADTADLLAHLAAAGKDPVVGRRRTWHPTKLST